MGSLRLWLVGGMAALLVAGVVELHSRTAATIADTPPAAAVQAVPTRAPMSATPAPLATPAARLVGLPDFTSLVATNAASVVNVSVVEKAQSARDISPFGGDADPFSQFFRHFQMPQPDRSPPARGTGSGFIVSGDGYVLTNAHVVADAATVSVRLTDRREFTARVIGVDKRSDVAVLKIAAKGLPTVRFGDASRLQPGQWVVAIGSPFGFESSVTAGVVSATARSLPDENYVPFIQTDVAVNPGNSGGPLFNLDGQVVGINSQIYSRTGGYMGLSFAIPIDLALSVKEQLIRGGKVSRSRIGVAVQEIDQRLAGSFGLDRPRGALISAVDEKGPAKPAGLQAGDVILSVDGKSVERSADLPSMIASIAPGSLAHLGVWRGKRALEIAVRTVALDDEPIQTARAEDNPDSDSKLGLALRALDANEQKQMGTQGRLLVEDVRGPALDAGIEAGDVVLGVNGTKVDSLEQLRTAVKRAGHNLALLVQRRDAQIYVPIDMS
jgi:serine protease Do